MKITYIKEIGCDGIIKDLETSKVVRVGNQLVGQNKNGTLVYINMFSIVKIED